MVQNGTPSSAYPAPAPDVSGDSDDMLRSSERPAVLPSAAQTPNPGPGPVSVPASTPGTTPNPAPLKSGAAGKTAYAKKSAPAPKPVSKPASKPAPGIVNPYVPYTYEQIMAESKKLAEKYPELLSADSIGSSVEGRELLMIKLGKGDKKIVLCGSHHAREYISSSYLMKMTEEYAKAYMGTGKFGNYPVKSLLDKITLYIVPMVNPDGVSLVNGGLKTVKNQDAVAAMAMLKPSYREWKANINGVDLNRQYPAYWEEKYDPVKKPASENFKGTAPATEPEVQAMLKLSSENEFILAASFHAKGNVIYWADKGTVELIPGVEDMSKKLSSLTKYRRMPVSEEPSVYGSGYENWFRLEFKRPAFCIELSPLTETDAPHDDRKFDSLVWNKAKYIGLFLADEALKR